MTFLLIIPTGFIAVAVGLILLLAITEGPPAPSTPTPAKMTVFTWIGAGVLAAFGAVIIALNWPWMFVVGLTGLAVRFLWLIRRRSRVKKITR